MPYEGPNIIIYRKFNVLYQKCEGSHCTFISLIFVTCYSVATSYFFESTVLFFTISRFCTFFCTFFRPCTFFVLFFINLAEFYQILFKSTVFVLFLEILQN